MREKEKINIKNHSLDWKLEKAKFRKKYYRHKLNILKKSLVNFGYEAGYIEITPKKIRRIGLRSVVVAIPDLQPIHLNEKFPYLDGHRLKSVPSKLGLRSAEEINRIPHPFP